MPSPPELRHSSSSYFSPVIPSGTSQAGSSSSAQTPVSDLPTNPIRPGLHRSSSESRLRGQLTQPALTETQCQAKRNELGKMLRNGTFNAAEFKTVVQQLPLAELNKQDSTGFTPVSMAVLHRNKDATRILQNNGALLKTSNANGLTAELMLAHDPETKDPEFAAKYEGCSAPEKADHLLKTFYDSMDAGKKQAIKDKTGKPFAEQDATAMMAMSSLKRSGALIDIEVNQSFEMNGHTFERLTALQGKALNGQDKKLKTLLALGADPNVQEPKLMDTALHLVFRARTTTNRAELYECAKALVESGADLNIKNGEGAQPLFQAARTAEGKSIQLLLDHGADIHAVNYKGSSAMHSAAFGGNLSAVKVLIEAGVDLTARNESGKTPLEMVDLDKTNPEERAEIKKLITTAIAEGGSVQSPAAKKADAEAEAAKVFHGKRNEINTLLEASQFEHGKFKELVDEMPVEELGKPGENGFNAASMAILTGNREALLALKQKKVNLDAHNVDGSTPNTLLRTPNAEQTARNEIGKMLRRPNFNEQEFAALLASLKPGDLSKLDNTGMNAASTAVLHGNERAVQMLRDKGVDFDAPNSNHSTANWMISEAKDMEDSGFAKGIREASQNERNMLLKDNAWGSMNMDVIEGRKPLRLTPEYLNEYNKEVPAQRAAQLMMASMICMKAGARLDGDIHPAFNEKRDDLPLGSTWTPLHYSIGNLDSPYARMALAMGADIHSRDPRYGYTPLHLVAMTRPDLDPVKQQALALMLLDQGADVAAPDSDGATAIYFACKNGNRRLVGTLAHHGGDVNAMINDGTTVAHMAAEKGDVALIEMLAQHKVDFSIKTEDGPSPLDIAKKKSPEAAAAIERLLAQHPAQSS